MALHPRNDDLYFRYQRVPVRLNDNAIPQNDSPFRLHSTDLGHLPRNTPQFLLHNIGFLTGKLLR
ncbi:hypothetical protein, partial [uncultured Roseobacter sp.]|uniref:hypothetical protein n=1 Tax=uncultured Roseobacter sp. TaxID=114847 RepID=UPI00261B6C5B